MSSECQKISEKIESFQAAFADFEKLFSGRKINRAYERKEQIDALFDSTIALMPPSLEKMIDWESLHLGEEIELGGGFDHPDFVDHIPGTKKFIVSSFDDDRKNRLYVIDTKNGTTTELGGVDSKKPLQMQIYKDCAYLLFEDKIIIRTLDGEYEKVIDAQARKFKSFAVRDDKIYVFDLFLHSFDKYIPGVVVFDLEGEQLTRYEDRLTRFTGVNLPCEFINDSIVYLSKSAGSHMIEKFSLEDYQKAGTVKPQVQTVDNTIDRGITTQLKASPSGNWFLALTHLRDVVVFYPKGGRKKFLKDIPKVAGSVEQKLPNGWLEVEDKLTGIIYSADQKIYLVNDFTAQTPTGTAKKCVLRELKFGYNFKR